MPPQRPPQPPQRPDREHELPMLAGIAAALRWVEELANIIAGPVLTAGLAIALVDLLTDGRLLTSWPALVYAWAVSQAVGVDMQLVGAWDKARAALRARRYGALAGLLLLGLSLAAVGYLAAVIFAMQQSAGISTAAALRQLGMDSASWLVSRAALSVVLVCLSGWTRYHPPARVAPSLDEERTQLQRELEIEPLRAQLRARKAIGWRDVGRSLIAGDAALAPVAAEARPDDAPPDPPPDHPSRPNGRDASSPSGADTDAAEDFPAGASLRLVAPAGPRSRRVAGKSSREELLRVQAFALLDADPGLSKAALRKALRCRQTTADALWAQWKHARIRAQATVASSS